MPIERDRLVQIMRQEAEEALLVIETTLVELERNPGDRVALQEVLGHVHTIKGDASIVHLNGVVEFAHELETVLEHIDNGALSLSGDSVSILLAAVDALRDLIARGVGGDHAVRPEQRILMARFGSMSRAADRPDGLSDDSQAALPESPAPRTAEIWRAQPPVSWTHKDAGRADRQVRADKSTLRVELRKLDRLLDLVGELLIHRGRVRQMLENPEASERPLGASALLEVHREADRLYLDLQELIMQARMVSMGPTLQSYARVIRDLCEAQGKYAHLSLVGDDVEVDAAIVERLRAPLTHLVRNAVDHGLELPAQRRMRGKEPVGTIAIHCAHESGGIVLRVADDGAGIDRSALLERARALGVIDGSEPSGQAVDELIFEPRLSTSVVVDDLSGRGMGMDIVRQRVTALRGSISVASTPGEGTAFTIRVPLTMAVIEGLAIGVADETFLIPLDAVVECLAMSERERERTYGLLDVRGQPVPYVRLRRLFGFEGQPAHREHVVIIDRDGRRVGLCVDALPGERHTVIKPLGRLFRSVPLVAGGAILGNGRVALILDIPVLMQQVLARAARAVAPGPSAGSLQPSNAVKDPSHVELDDHTNQDL